MHGLDEPPCSVGRFDEARSVTCELRGRAISARKLAFRRWKSDGTMVRVQIVQALGRGNSIRALIVPGPGGAGFRSSVLP